MKVELGDAFYSGWDHAITKDPSSTIEHGVRVGNGGSIRFRRVANQLKEIDAVTVRGRGCHKPFSFAEATTACRAASLYTVGEGRGFSRFPPLRAFSLLLSTLEFSEVR